MQWCKSQGYEGQKSKGTGVEGCKKWRAQDHKDTRIQECKGARTEGSKSVKGQEHKGTRV